MTLKWKQELELLEVQRQIINLQKKELWKKIANLRNKIAVYQIRYSEYGK